MQSVDIYQKYLHAVSKFNALKSFQIFLPHNNNDLIDNTEYDAFLLDIAKRFTDKIENIMIPALVILQKHRNKRNEYTDMEKSNEICKFVVHLNQITNMLKHIDAPEISFE
jgi:hypothetical protein